jgi:gamma-glutamylcyclotransferase (GGCT)/AIG2-like uncharacterized protein YtfP
MLIATYGSLKKDFHNHHRLGPNPIYKGKSTIEGIMYLCGNYPHLYLENDYPNLGEKLKRNHEIEIYDISPEIHGEINSMEYGAGYTMKLIDTEFGQASIWINELDLSPYLQDNLIYIEKYTLETYKVNLPLEIDNFLRKRANLLFLTLSQVLRANLDIAYRDVELLSNLNT